MHPKLATGRVAIYARYSSDLQSQASIEDQARRARELIARSGGDPTKAIVFPDFAISGASLERPGLEALMRAVEDGKVDVIVTEDISRLSRDIGDAAHLFKRLQFAGVPLLGLSDGIDTSQKHGKLSFTVKSIFAELYLDDLRDKTLRGLEGRALAGFATGGMPYGYRTVAETDGAGRIVGHRIVIDEDEAKIVRRIFQEYRDDGALHRIARALNRDGIPSPRVGTRHKHFGWGPTTVRAILYNEKYAGTWRYKQHQWVKMPGTNKRRKRKRSDEEVMTVEHPELRIVDAELWSAVRARLTAIYRKYTKASEGGEKIASPRRCSHVLSGIVVCDECGFPLKIYGGRRRYYRCGTAYEKGMCASELRVREEVLREVALGAIRMRLQSDEQVARVRKEVAQRLGDYSQTLDAEIRERRARVTRTEERIQSLVEFIAGGERSEYVAASLRDLEAQAKTDRAAIDRLQREAQAPLRLPSPDEVVEAVFRFDAMLAGDTEVARSRLRRWLKDGVLRVARAGEGFEVRGNCFPLAVLVEDQKIKANQRLGSAESNVQSTGALSS